MDTQIQSNFFQKASHENGFFPSSNLNESLARQMDDADPLKNYRDLFYIPRASASQNSQAVYLCGHSLGLQPKATKAYISKELERWEENGVEGHFVGEDPWVTYDETCVDSMAKIVGAKSSEIVLMNSLTVNIHLMLTAFYRPTKNKNKILMENGAFPSDTIAVKSHIRHHGYNPSTSLLVLEPSNPSDNIIQDADILEQIERHGDSIALIFLGGVNYYTGQAYDIENITRVGQSHGCIVGFDLAHAAGNIALKLNKWGCDFAVWCTYKYLNSGPGGIGGCYVKEKHGKDLSIERLAGWWSHDKTTRFLMKPDLKLAEGASGFALSNPSILCLAALRASLDIYDQVGMEAFARKSRLLTGYMATLLGEIQRNGENHFEVISPSEGGRRGCQLSLIFSSSSPRTILERLRSEAGVMVDFREPNCIRVAPNPFYNSFADVYKFVNALEEILLTK